MSDNVLVILWAIGMPISLSISAALLMLTHNYISKG